MNIEHFDILELIPQRRPFVLVDELVDFCPESSVTTFRVTGDCILLRDGCLSEAGLMENIAQSCAARIGYINKISNKAVLQGVIGAVNGFKVEFMPPVGSLITTRIEVLNEIFGLTQVSAVSECSGKTVATCRMTVSLVETK
ncbi:MAG: pseudouridylate synthase [Candidatus Cryptobacteroides sp.]